MIADDYCTHHWTRDDMHTLQCVRCGARKPAKDE